MIAKKYRLREYEIQRVFKKGRLSFGKYWNMNVFQNTRGGEKTYSRMAVSISKKHDKRAVQRNRYRRALYDALLPHLKMSRSCFLCLFTLKKGLFLTEKDMPEEWKKDAVQLFSRQLR